MNQPASPASSDPLLTGLLARITSNRPGADGQLITRAYQAAAHWHQGQTRKSGDAYLTHPVAVAQSWPNWTRTTRCCARLCCTIGDEFITGTVLHAEGAQLLV